MAESYRDILSKLVDAQRETATATIVLAENVAALHESMIAMNRENQRWAQRMTDAVEAKPSAEGAE